jgi:membrane associated rhomboid family serine protease
MKMHKDQIALSKAIESGDTDLGIIICYQVFIHVKIMNHIGGVMVSVLVSSVIDHWFQPQPNHRL